MVLAVCPPAPTTTTTIDASGSSSGGRRSRKHVRRCRCCWHGRRLLRRRRAHLLQQTPEPTQVERHRPQDDARRVRHRRLCRAELSALPGDLQSQELLLRLRRPRLAGAAGIHLAVGPEKRRRPLPGAQGAVGNGPEIAASRQSRREQGAPGRKRRAGMRIRHTASERAYNARSTGAGQGAEGGRRRGRACAAAATREGTPAAPPRSSRRRWPRARSFEAGRCSTRGTRGTSARRCTAAWSFSGRPATRRSR